MAELHTQTPSSKLDANLAYFQDVCPWLTDMTYRRFLPFWRGNWGPLWGVQADQMPMLRQLNPHNPYAMLVPV